MDLLEESTMIELTIVLSFLLIPRADLEALDPYVVCIEHNIANECACEAILWPWEEPSTVCEDAP